jgi:hypothetical protein
VDVVIVFFASILLKLALTPPHLRNFEAIKLRRKHLMFDQVTQDGRRLPHWVCSLTDRKGWQRQLNEGDLRGMCPFLSST